MTTTVQTFFFLNTFEPFLCNKRGVFAKRWGDRGHTTVSRLLEVDVGISQRSSGDDVTTHTDRHDGSSRREFLVEHGLRDVSVQVSDIQRRQGVCWSAAVHRAEQLVQQQQQHLHHHYHRHHHHQTVILCTDGHHGLDSVFFRFKLVSHLVLYYVIFLLTFSSVYNKIHFYISN